MTIKTLLEAQQREHFPHDECPECQHPSFPAEGVPDQALRICVGCETTWFEDLDKPPRKHEPHPD